MDLQQKRKIDLWIGGAALCVLRPWVRLLGKWLRRDHSLAPQGSILIVKLLGGGSLVIAYPSLLGLKKRYPNLKISILCTPSIKPFAESLNVFAEFIVINDKTPYSLVSSFLKNLWKLWSYDTVIDLEVHSRLCALLTLFTLARNRIGFYTDALFWKRTIHTHLLFFNKTSPTYIFYEQIFQLLDISLPTRAESQRVFKQSLGAEQVPMRRLAVGCGCSDLSPERMLSPIQWLEIFKQRCEEEISEIIFLGGAADADIASQIQISLEKKYPDKQISNLCGKLTMKQSLQTLAQASVYWGIDSGLLHFARLLGIPSLSFWGPTSPHVLLAPMEDLKEEVVYHKIPCSPCVHMTEVPPCGGDNVCIKKIFNPEIPIRGMLYVHPAK